MISAKNTQNSKLRFYEQESSNFDDAMGSPGLDKLFEKIDDHVIDKKPIEPEIED